MKNVINKADLDKLIRLRKKYWKTGDFDILDACYPYRERIEKESGIDAMYLCDVIDAVVDHRLGTLLHGRYEDVYTVLGAFGLKISEEGEHEETQTAKEAI